MNQSDIFNEHMKRRREFQKASDDVFKAALAYAEAKARLDNLALHCIHPNLKITEGCGTYQNATRRECRDCGLDKLSD